MRNLSIKKQPITQGSLWKRSQDALIKTGFDRISDSADGGAYRDWGDCAEFGQIVDIRARSARYAARSAKAFQYPVALALGRNRRCVDQGLR